jgi:hypothetical protein
VRGHGFLLSFGFGFLLEHDPFRKPVSTFRDHARVLWVRRAATSIATGRGTSELLRGALVRARAAALASGDLVTRLARPLRAAEFEVTFFNNIGIDSGVDLGY